MGEIEPSCELYGVAKCIHSIHCFRFLIQNRLFAKIRCIMESNHEFNEILSRLKSILSPFIADLNLVKDSDSAMYLETPSKPGSKGEFFASAEIKKNYVSFHLMPIYCFPDIAQAFSRELSRRRQGKSCFNFKKIEPQLFDELSKHIKTGIERYRLEGKL